MALGDIHLRFTWQAWHFVTSTLSSHHLSSHYLSAHNLSSHYLSTHNLSTCHHTTCVFTLLVHTQLTHTQLVIRPHLITPLVITPLVFTLLVFTLLVHRATKKKDHVHDRSEQFLRNRLPLFLCCLLSVGATLLHLPPWLGRSTTLRCRDLC